MGTLKNLLVWSSSRDGTFRTCRRRYYYNYYGSWGGWETGAEPATRELYALKQLTNRFFWAGSVVHDEVSGFLRREMAGGPSPEPGEVGEQAVHMMRGQYKTSRDTSPEAFRSDPKRTFRLMEHHYSMDVSRERWKETADKVEKSLRNFFRSEAYASLKSLPFENWLHVEDPAAGPDRINIRGMDLYALPDCVYRDENDTVHVIDWKTGWKEAANWDQLALYALYAQERWDVPAVSVRAREVNLFLGKDTEHRLDEDLLDGLCEKVRAGLADMTACLVDGDADRNEALPEETFALTDDPHACRMCSFQGICPAVTGNR